MRPIWHPVWVVIAFGISTLLYVSWFEIASARAVWDMADTTLFRALNNTLEDAPVWVDVWAVMNNRLFDAVAGVAFGLIFLHYVVKGTANSPALLERMAACLVIGISILLVAQVSKNHLELQRISPTLSEPDVIFLSEEVTWIKTKDRSTNSFPGDHGMVALMFALYLIYLGGKPYARFAVPLLLLSTAPRLVSGAHWLTDVAVGSTMLALPMVALVAGTPLLSRSATLMAGLARRKVPGCEPWLQHRINRFV